MPQFYLVRFFEWIPVDSCWFWPESVEEWKVLGAGAGLFHAWGASSCLSCPLHVCLFVYPDYSSSSCTTILLHCSLIVYRADFNQWTHPLAECQFAFFISKVLSITMPLFLFLLIPNWLGYLTKYCVLPQPCKHWAILQPYLDLATVFFFFFCVPVFLPAVVYLDIVQLSVCIHLTQTRDDWAVKQSIWQIPWQINHFCTVYVIRSDPWDNFFLTVCLPIVRGGWQNENS